MCWEVELAFRGVDRDNTCRMLPLVRFFRAARNLFVRQWIGRCTDDELLLCVGTDAF